MDLHSNVLRARLINMVLVNFCTICFLFLGTVVQLSHQTITVSSR